MLEYLMNVGGRISDAIGSLDRMQWFYVFVGAVIIGILCMRGFGSRKDY